MPWAAIDDQFFHNRKARAVGPLGRELFVASVCYCNMQLNDGCFVAEDVQVIAALAQVEPDIADRLISHGLWHPEGHDCPKCRAAGQTMPVPPGHISVHEFLLPNRSREQVIADRLAAAERKRRSRATSRRDSHRTDAESHAGGSASPDPTPSPPSDPVNRHPGNSRGDTPVRLDDESGSSSNGTVPDEVWEHYAQIMLTRQPAGEVKKPRPWKARTASNARNELDDKAHRWWVGYQGMTPHRLAQCLVDDAPPRELPFTVPDGPPEPLGAP